MRHGSDPGDVCVVQGRSVVVTWAGVGSGQSAEKAGQCEGRRLRDYPIPVPS